MNAHKPADEDTDDNPRARRGRSRRLAAGVVVGVAAIAVALPVGLNLAGSPADQAGVDLATTTPTPTAPRTSLPAPTARPSTSASPTVAASPAPTPGPVVELHADKAITVDVEELPRGEAPRIPWFVDGEIRDGTSTTPVDLSEAAFQSVDGGYLLHRRSYDAYRIEIIGLDGTERFSRAVTSAAVSRDGRRVAWAQLDGTVGVTEARTGQALHTTEAGTADPVEVGILGERVVLSSGSWKSPTSKVQVWDPRTGERTLWSDFYDARVTDGASIAVVTPRVAQGRMADYLMCVAAVDADDGSRELWRACPPERGSVYITDFSANGRYAVMDVFEGDAGFGDATIADARTGRALLTIKTPRQFIAWEDDQHFLVLITRTYGGERSAIIRCTLAGTCERAVEPDTETSERGYQLDLAPLPRASEGTAGR